MRSGRAFPFKWQRYDSLATADPNVTVLITGLAATGELGTSTITGGAGVSPSGLAATGAIGTLTVTGSGNVSASGLAASGAIGTETVTGGATIAPSGLDSNAQLGSSTVTGASNTSLSGLGADSALGDLTVIGGALVDLSGLHAGGATGDPDVTGDESEEQEGLEATGALGDVEVATTGSARVKAGESFKLRAKRFWFGSAGPSEDDPAAARRAAEKRSAVAGLGARGAIGSVLVRISSNATPKGSNAKACAPRAALRGDATVPVPGCAGRMLTSRARVRAIQNPTDEELALLAMELAE